jgi:hypothetical protein
MLGDVAQVVKVRNSEYVVWCTGHLLRKTGAKYRKRREENIYGSGYEHSIQRPKPRHEDSSGSSGSSTGTRLSVAPAGVHEKRLVQGTLCRDYNTDFILKILINRPRDPEIYDFVRTTSMKKSCTQACTYLPMATRTPL